MEPATAADIERLDARMDGFGSDMGDMKMDIRSLKTEMAQRREVCMEHSIKTREHGMSIDNMGRTLDRLEGVVKDFTEAVVSLKVSMATVSERNKGTGKFVENARDWVGKALLAIIMLILGYLLKGG